MSLMEFLAIVIGVAAGNYLGNLVTPWFKRLVGLTPRQENKK